MFRLSIETDNAAFDENCGEETIRILKEAIEYIEEGIREHSLIDLNGNVVGKYSLKKR